MHNETVDHETGEIVEIPPVAISTWQDKVTLTRTALIVHGDLTFEEYCDLAQAIDLMGSGWQWWKGGQLNYGDRRYGEQAAQAEQEDGNAGTYANLAWVERQVESSRRRDDLSFGHHQEVAPFEKREQNKLLDWCEETTPPQSISKLRAEIRKRRQTKISEELPEGTYNVIYVDAPWQYDNYGASINGAADDHYPTMPFEDIKAIPQQEGFSFAKDAVLFLWVTNQFINEALELIGEWGFEYKTNMVWVKTDLVKPGAGFYVRGRHELLFICTRGNFTPLDKNISPPIGSVLEAPLGEHSRKPEEVYDIIERLYPGCVYIELFARNERDGWKVWGNEAG